MFESESQARGVASAEGATAGVSKGLATVPIVLSIAGFDPSSGAGVTADLKVFAAHGSYGMACITALTVQSTQGVRSVEPLAAGMVAATLEALAGDVIFSGIKIGMLATAEIAVVVGDFIDGLAGVPAVLDPVFRSSSGRELLSQDGIRVVRERMLRRVNWITPNLDELAILVGNEALERSAVPAAAVKLKSMAAASGNAGLNVLVTGGHLDRPDDYLLSATGESGWIPGEFVDTTSTHGTGCALSSSLLCRSVAGDSPQTAVRCAKEYVTSALRAAYPVGKGKGPMHHLFNLPPVGSNE